MKKRKLTTQVKKEEALLSNFLPNEFEFNPFEETEIDKNIKIDNSFTKVLDFSFPEEVDSDIAQIGEVIYIGDGVCKVAGLPNAKMEDILIVKTEKGMEKTMILGINDTHLETVVLGDYRNIKQGDQVLMTNSRLKIPTGKNLLGRIINPLGEALDEKGSLKAETERDMEFPAPSVMMRMPIFEPLSTGIMTVDSTIPVGKGQRELIIGDRKTGKSRLAVDIMCNQKGKNVICVYVGVGIQAAKAKAALQLLTERGAMDYTCLVLSMSDDPPSLQYLAPYTGVAIAEHFCYQGKHVLVIFDDLSKQAKAYREVSLLLKRSPGRDAYPGDIFFLHSRLLERIAKLDEKSGAGSITSFPIAETQSGDVSDYIITNLMSITDGHIFLDANMMHDGILPAVNSGLSVSRIGSKVQVPLLRKIGELTGRALARYQEVKSFETMNTEVAEDTLRDIKRGKVVTEVLSQPSDICYSTDEEVIILHLATSGKMDNYEVFEVNGVVKNFLKFYRENKNDELVQICQTGKDLNDIENQVNELFENFKKQPTTN